MPKFLIATLLACLAIVGLTACGSSAPGSAGGSPTSATLSYFPAGSPLIATVQTDPNSPGQRGAKQLEAKLPFAGIGQATAQAKLQQLGINYNSDIKPLLGNPIAVGLAGTDFASARQNLLAVWITKSRDKLLALLHRVPGLSQSGTHAGATLYLLGGAVAAVSDSTLVLGLSRSVVTAALDRHAHPSGSARLPSSLPSDSLVNVFGDLTAVLASPKAAKAKAVPWVAALKSYATAISAGNSGMRFSFSLDTTGATLTSDQLPLAPGGGSLAFAGNGPITVSVLNPAHILAFAEAVDRQTNPKSYADFQARQAKVKARTGVDLNSLLKLLDGDLILSSDTKTTLVRVGVSDAAAAASDLRKLSADPQGVFKDTVAVTPLGGGFLKLTGKGTAITVGVLGAQLLVGIKSHAGAAAIDPATLRTYAAAPTTPASAGQGSGLAFRVATQSLLGLLGHGASTSAITGAMLKLLGDVTGSAAETASALTGQANLALGG